MPIMKVKTKSGATGYKYGASGHVYPSRAGALNQMRAMYANGYTGSKTHTGRKHGHKQLIIGQVAKYYSKQHSKGGRVYNGLTNNIGNKQRN